MFKIHKEELEVNGKKLVLETGKIARQADGAIIAPSACLAILPVSNIIFLPFISTSSLLILNIISLNLIVLILCYMTLDFFFLNMLRVFFFY